MTINTISTTWGLGDYPGIGFGGAAKLISSAVAPLVSFTRGTLSVNRDNVATASKDYRLPNRRASQGRRFLESIDAGDVLLMPWYGLTGIVTASAAGRLPVFTSMQYRPDVPAVFDGREVKYEFVIGDRTPVEAHPATPVAWLSGTMPVIVAEGQLKADSALTGMLLDAGVTTDDLKVVEGESLELAMARLTAMMEALEAPFLILPIAGVHNWRHNAGEWQWVTLAGRTVYLGMDGDVATNPAVHSSTAMLWRTLEQGKALPKLLAVNIEGAGEDHLGIDDYLANHGTWAGLLAMAANEMPEYPAALSADQVGKFRISDDMTFLEKCLPVKDPSSGDVVRGMWQSAGIDIGARVASFTTSRVPSKMEDETGVLEASASLGDATVEIEVAWIDPTQGGIRKGTIEGPADILNHTPDRWADKGARIPYTLLVHPHWPPSGLEARSWMQAVKEFRADQRVDVTRWTRMGWVPQPDGRLPAFIVGEQIIGDEDSVTLVTSGVSDDTLSECSGFGVDELDARPFTDRRYLKKLAKAWTWMIQNYLVSNAWTDARIGSLIVAAGLRPCLPVRTNSSMYFPGPPAGGKALPMDALLPVPVSAKFPSGWAFNSELAEGDSLYAPDGTVTPIRGLSQVWTDGDCYELTMSDGQVLRASGNHVMVVSTKLSRAAHAGFDARTALRSHEQGLATKAAGLRQTALSLRSGDAANLTDISTMTGLHRNVVYTLVSEAGLPNEKVMQHVGAQHTTEFDTADPRIQALAPGASGWLTPHEINEFAGMPVKPISARQWLRNRTSGVATRSGVRTINRPILVYPLAEALTVVADHLETAGEVQPMTVSRTVADMAKSFGTNIGYAIPVAAPIHGEDIGLLIPAYTLGAWLGDGTTREGSITFADLEIKAEIESDGFPMTKWASNKYGWTIHGLHGLLKTVGVRDNKHIPANYRRASIETRLALLQGLMDTDGTVNKGGKCEIALCRDRLARDVVELVRSLGIKASFRTGAAAITETDAQGNITRRKVGTRYRIAFFTTQQVFRLPRKAARLRATETSRADWIYVRDIRRVKPVPSRCLQVEHPIGQFLAEGFLTTHNSWSAAAVATSWPALGPRQTRRPD